MIALLAIGMLAWIGVCTVVLALCVMAARGDGRQTRRTVATRHARSSGLRLVRQL